MTSFQSPSRTFTLAGEFGAFAPSFSASCPETGVELITVRLRADAPAPPPPFQIQWKHPSIEIQGTWTPSSGWAKGLRADWDAPFASRAAASAPVVCLHAQGGANRLTFAASEVRDALKLRAGIHEETGEFLCGVEFFSEPNPGIAEYEVTLRLDTRDVPYHRALRDVVAWWASLPGCEPARVPEAACRPMYSTWYSFHQQLVPAEVEEQCRLAKELGCEAVIVDDGWQTLDSGRGYAYCGDWEPERIPGMRAHVERVHRLGLKFMLWYAVPFVGIQSKAYARFRDKMLAAPWEWSPGTHILDPRFPEVREYLIATYERGLREWDLDGFKLDFVDMFKLAPVDVRAAGGGRDTASLSLAVDRLMTDVMARLRAIKPEVLIEFRQSYVGPLMRKYGNMFRASDCPNDALRNRVKTLDVRLLAGSTAVHSDMLMWHPDDSAESAGLQIINVLFSVPQISVDLRRMSGAHRNVCRFWLAFWSEHRDVLLDGELEPQHPELLYPTVVARGGAKLLAAFYGAPFGHLPGPVPGELHLINATDSHQLHLELPHGRYAAEVFDCEGRVVARAEHTHGSSVLTLPVPRAGLARLTASL